jgi:signal transduction histidine kinase
MFSYWGRTVRRRWGAWTTGVVAFGALMWVSQNGTGGWASPARTWQAAAGTPSLGEGVVGGALVAATLVVVSHWRHHQRDLESDRERIESLERAIVDSTRDQRERLHELRSTVAGLVTGSAMLDRDDITPETRERLWGSVRRELDRLDRLLAGRETPATEIDLDEALDRILDLQRLKGRHVELRSTGDDVVRARFDSLAEVVNVLIDNATVHGGADASVVEVVRRDDDNVDIRVTDHGTGIPEDQRATIFDWGRRGSRSPGEGIGLNVAKRLMTEDGGSLRLDDEQEVGSSFVITLPAARRSSENGITLPAARRSLENGITYEGRHECRITG